MRAVESCDIARKIYEIENADFKTKAQWNREGKTRWVIAEPLYPKEYSHDIVSIHMEMSSDHMCWYLWNQTADQVRLYWKVVPRMGFTQM